MVFLLSQVGSQVVLFGGERDNGPLDDLWLLAGFGPGETLRWTQVKLRTSPAPRFGHALAGGLGQGFAWLARAMSDVTPVMYE